MGADLVRTAGQQFTLHERQSAVRRERAVARACGLGTRHAGPVQRDLLALFITTEIVLDQPLGPAWVCRARCTDTAFPSRGL